MQLQIEARGWGTNEREAKRWDSRRRAGCWWDAGFTAGHGGREGADQHHRQEMLRAGRRAGVCARRRRTRTSSNRRRPRLTTSWPRPPTSASSARTGSALPSPPSRPTTSRRSRTRWTTSSRARFPAACACGWSVPCPPTISTRSTACWARARRWSARTSTLASAASPCATVRRTARGSGCSITWTPSTPRPSPKPVRAAGSNWHRAPSRCSWTSRCSWGRTSRAGGSCRSPSRPSSPPGATAASWRRRSARSGGRGSTCPCWTLPPSACRSSSATRARRVRRCCC